MATIYNKVQEGGYSFSEVYPIVENEKGELIHSPIPVTVEGLISEKEGDPMILVEGEVLIQGQS